MVISFGEKYLKELYEEGVCSDKKHRYQPQIIKIYRRRIETLEAMESPEKLYQFNALHFEALVGDKKGRYSIKVNNQYRIEFTINTVSEEPLVIICNIVELSNHYK